MNQAQRDAVKNAIKFSLGDNETNISMGNDKQFTARVVNNYNNTGLDGIIVSNLGAQPFLIWKAFEEVINLLLTNGESITGYAMKGVLGDECLPLNSVEGWVAHTLYNRQIGQHVFRRITPLRWILGRCELVNNGHGYLSLTELATNLMNQHQDIN